MTVLEITHSKTEAEMEQLVRLMEDKIPEIADYAYDHTPALGKPMLSYDAAAIALSFLPADCAPAATKPDGETKRAYTYHHLRRDMYSLCKSAGVEVASRYVVPSAHLTIARFVSQKDIEKGDGSGPDPVKVKALVNGLERIDADLRNEHGNSEGQFRSGTWFVGEEKGLDCRKGRLWYGGGTTIRLGRSFGI